jgi:SPP1 family predicted phage head-tail adaptor
VAMIPIGRLNRMVSLDTPTQTADGQGGFTTTWAALSPARVGAAVMPASTIERTLASTLQSTTSHIVEIRYHSAVTTKTRITLGSRYLYVRGVENIDEANVVLRLRCEEVAA